MHQIDIHQNTENTAMQVFHGTSKIYASCVYTHTHTHKEREREKERDDDDDDDDSYKMFYFSF
jgi:hypothetical protein